MVMITRSQVGPVERLLRRYNEGKRSFPNLDKGETINKFLFVCLIKLFIFRDDHGEFGRHFCLHEQTLGYQRTERRVVERTTKGVEHEGETAQVLCYGD